MLSQCFQGLCGLNQGIAPNQDKVRGRRTGSGWASVRRAVVPTAQDETEAEKALSGQAAELHLLDALAQHVSKVIEN